MNPISRIAPVTDAEAAQMVYPDTLADLAERLTSTPVEAAAAEAAAGNAAWHSPTRSRGWHATAWIAGPPARAAGASPRPARAQLTRHAECP
jgi:hypothetical protein